MSYIVAFVSFSESDKIFPVNCFRTDAKSGDEVVFRRKDGKLKIAEIKILKYLNWDCAGQIECKKEECTLSSHGEIVLPPGCPYVHGLSTLEYFVEALKSLGWIPIKPKQRMYTAMLANLNSSTISYIFIRKNGVDIQILPRADNNPLKPYSLYDRSLTEGKSVRHSLAHTTFNLFEGILRFSNSFLSEEADLERYFISQGESDKRTGASKKQTNKLNAANNEMRDIYDACSDGGGGPAYLGDGMWISSDGGLHELGR